MVASFARSARPWAALADGTLSVLSSDHCPFRWRDQKAIGRRDFSRIPNGAPTIGNYYATQYADAWEVATRTAAALPELEQQTLRFVNAFCAGDLPDVVVPGVGVVDDLAINVVVRNIDGNSGALGNTSIDFQRSDSFLPAKATIC